MPQAYFERSPLFPGDSEQDETHVRILEAACDVLSEIGFRKTSMEEVARRAGVSRITLYRRFTDKQSLLHEVILREARKSLQNILVDIASEEAAADRFVKGFVATVLVARRHTLFRRLMESDSEIVLPRYAAVTASQLIDFGRTHVAGLITMLQASGLYPYIDANYLAEMLLRLWHSLVLVPSTQVDSDNEESLTRLARDFLFPLLTRD